MRKNMETKILIPFSKKDGKYLQDTEKLLKALQTELVNSEKLKMYVKPLVTCMNGISDLSNQYQMQKESLDKLEKKTENIHFLEFDD